MFGNSQKFNGIAKFFGVFNIAEVKRDLGLPMYDAPNAVEELKQPRKHPTAEKVEAIKDALKYFGVI